MHSNVHPNLMPGEEPELYDVSQWLQMLITYDGTREKAISNWTAQGKRREQVADFNTAMNRAFDWSDTPEGYRYWSLVAIHPGTFVEEGYHYLL
ncbi:MAG: hypothetical protein P4L51_06205 [Puia sp.]|nr:hypothetical protein [Puia sp.]